MKYYRDEMDEFFMVAERSSHLPTNKETESKTF